MRYAYALLAHLLLCLTAAAQHYAEESTLARYTAIDETQVSPDGATVAYVTRAAKLEGEQSEFVQQLWLAATDGSRDVAYTYGEKSSWHPRFSPDGSSLAFLSKRGGDQAQVYVLRVSGGEARPVTTQKTGVTDFAWSPRGDKIGFSASDTLTADEELATAQKRDMVLVDSSLKRTHLYTVMVGDTTSVKRLTSGERHVMSFDWAPDGSALVFAYTPDGRFSSTFSGGDIAVVPADSGTVRELVVRPGADTDPYFSPDGETVGFASSGGTIENVGLRDVHVVPVAGGEPRALAHTPDRNVQPIGWHPDGKRVLVLEAAGTSTTVYALDAASDHGVSAGLTPGEGTTSAVSIAPDGSRLAYVYETPGTPEEVFVARPDGSAAQQLTHQNDDYVDAPIARTELITWPSTEGMTVEGLLTYPLDYREGQRYPVLLQVHGGPAGVHQRGFIAQPSAYNPQAFAERGYFVLRPNPRGSTGYGKDFRYANVRDWGMGDYRDLMAGLDHVIALGLADADRQFLMGWSYGGYMTSWTVTQTDRFRAASMGAGLPELVSMTVTTDIGDYLVAHMGGKEPWEDWEEYQRHSPMRYFDRVVTPTQVIHGANDLRVPFAQGQAFFNALERKGVATEMIVYPRTPHGPTEPKFVMDVTPRILAWFARYGGPGQGDAGTATAAGE